jgi:hypothetical protein
MGSDFREDQVERLTRSAAATLATAYQLMLHDLRPLCADRTLDEVKALLVQGWSSIDSGKLTDPELTRYATTVLAQDGHVFVPPGDPI